MKPHKRPGRLAKIDRQQRVKDRSKDKGAVKLLEAVFTEKKEES